MVFPEIVRIAAERLVRTDISDSSVAIVDRKSSFSGEYSAVDLLPNDPSEDSTPPNEDKQTNIVEDLKVTALKLFQNTLRSFRLTVKPGSVDKIEWCRLYLIALSASHLGKFSKKFSELYSPDKTLDKLKLTSEENKQVHIQLNGESLERIALSNLILLDKNHTTGPEVKASDLQEVMDLSYNIEKSLEKTVLPFYLRSLKYVCHLLCWIFGLALYSWYFLFHTWH